MEKPTTYIVKRGDTLYKIATSFNTTVDELKKINNISNNTIYVGQILNLPKPIIPPTEEENPENPGEEIYTIYTVQKGDSLWSIARNYNITVQELIDINKLLSTTIREGQQLKVPVMSLENYYIVKSGDTLWSIAKKNNTTVDQIKKLNNLSSNLLVIGQQLIITK